MGCTKEALASLLPTVEKWYESEILPRYSIFISVINFPLFSKLRITVLSNDPRAQAVPRGPEMWSLLLGPFQPKSWWSSEPKPGAFCSAPPMTIASYKYQMINSLGSCFIPTLLLLCLLEIKLRLLVKSELLPINCDPKCIFLTPL